MNLDFSGASNDPAERLFDLVARSKRIVAFTGAGISTDSGVPDFRSPGSPWTINKPIPFSAFVASADIRKEAWRRKFAMDDHYKDARPNAGHQVLASLAKKGRLFGIITQNIDGLHQQSGIAADKIIELHGNGTYAACLDCKKRHELAWIRSYYDTNEFAPSCTECNGLLKSATVSFGQTMPTAEMQRAYQMATTCDLFIAIGSSLVVFPAASFLDVAKEAGAQLVIINGQETAFDVKANLVMRSDISTALDPLQAVPALLNYS